MYNFILLFISILLSFGTIAQKNNDSLWLHLNEIQLRQSNMTKASMISLSSWAFGNVVYGSIANFNSTGEAKYFHQMNAAWNVVNLGIGIPGLLSAYKKKTPMEFRALNTYQHRVEKVYYVNAGLDVAYVMTGVALRFYGKDKPGVVGHRWRGYGSSLIMQGGYLLIHDIAMILMYRTNTRLFDKSWEHVRLSSNGLNLKLELQ